MDKEFWEKHWNAQTKECLVETLIRDHDERREWMEDRHIMWDLVMKLARYNYYEKENSRLKAELEIQGTMFRKYRESVKKGCEEAGNCAL